jgi:hypothetical protein
MRKRLFGSEKLELIYLAGFGLMITIYGLQIRLVMHGQYNDIAMFQIYLDRAEKRRKWFCDYRFRVFHSKADFKSYAAHQCKLKKRRLIDVITRREVFYYHTGMDCDHSYWEHPCKYDNIFHAEKCIDSAYEDAEGALTFTRITRDEYDRCKERGNVSRDLALEAHENGHPHSIHL